MKRSIKNAVSKTPGVGKIARASKQFLDLPEYKQAQERQLLEIQKEVQSVLDEFSKKSTELSESVKALQAIQDNMQQQILAIEGRIKAGGDAERAKKEDVFAEDHALDTFYANFEDRFRGTEVSIEKRLKIYLPYFKESGVNFDKFPVLDIGSGRGELLSLLKKTNINAVGLDINTDMVDRANKLGLKTELGNALEYLQAAKSQSLGAVTGFHIAEHIPFNNLYRLFQAAHRALVPGGFIIFETPNPENLVVGSHNFYMDPSHLHPLPPALLEFTLESCGYRKVEIKRLHPDKLVPKNIPKAVKERLFGPRDYAAIGYK